jgi:nucleoside-diphosphate-sugar epimerase
MNCLVTGASGFIGSALVKRLIREGHHVRAVLHTSPPRHRDKQVDYITADLTDASSLSDLVKDGDIVFHCVALVKDFGSKKEIMNVNYKGTQHLVEACEKKIKRFIYLSHLHTLSKKTGSYSRSKAVTEHYLLQKYQQEQFPVVIIRPGNVYGPGATIWCLRPLEAIKQGRIALIEQGAGIFLHTYIDNLLDALLSTLTTQYIEGEVFEITDGDHTITWKTYLNDLSAILGKPPITRNITRTTASLISWYMMMRYYLFHKDPLLTPTAVRIFTNKQSISLEKATKLLGYIPVINYAEGMKRMELWLKTEQYI